MSDGTAGDVEDLKTGTVVKSPALKDGLCDFPFIKYEGDGAENSYRWLKSLAQKQGVLVNYDDNTKTIYIDGAINV